MLSNRTVSHVKSLCRSLHVFIDARLLVYSCLRAFRCVRTVLLDGNLASSMRIQSGRTLLRGVATKRVHVFNHVTRARTVFVCVLRTPVYNPSGSESPGFQLGRSIPPSPLQNGLGVHLGLASRPSTPRPHPLSGEVKRDLLGGPPPWRAIGGTIHTARACDSN